MTSLSAWNTTARASTRSAVVRFGPLQLWVLANPSPESGWPPGCSAATWVHDDGDEIQIVEWFVPASA